MPARRARPLDARVPGNVGGAAEQGQNMEETQDQAVAPPAWTSGSKGGQAAG